MAAGGRAMIPLAWALLSVLPVSDTSLRRWPAGCGVRATSPRASSLPTITVASGRRSPCGCDLAQGQRAFGAGEQYGDPSESAAGAECLPELAAAVLSGHQGMHRGSDPGAVSVTGGA